MKRVLPLLLILFGFSSFMNAQWVSPGNGTSYTMNDLVNLSDGTVTNDASTFTIHDDITISANDILVLNDHVGRININNALITIQGSLISENTAVRVGIYGTPSFSIRFENASNCDLRKLYFSDGAGIKLIESEVSFTDCKFLYFTRDYCNAVVDFFNCSPVFDNCVFMINNGAAISSPANGQGSPTITNCTFDENVKDAFNSPQINLGPGADDTIRIVNNSIIGTYCQSPIGGLSIADMMGTGSTKALIKNNLIKDGRYGYNQQGMTISSLIIGNSFIDNNRETNPINGGSGISIYGYSENCRAIIRNNEITGNLWGITSIYINHVDLGTEDDWGNNDIHGNGNNGVIYDLYNNSSFDIMAIGNKWGVTDQQEIEDHIYHQADDASLGLVTYIPYVGYDSVEDFYQEIDLLNDSDVTIYTISGQRVGRGSLKPGVYLVELKKGSDRTFQKMIIK